MNPRNIILTKQKIDTVTRFSKTVCRYNLDSSDPNNPIPIVYFPWLSEPKVDFDTLKLCYPELDVEKYVNDPNRYRFTPFYPTENIINDHSRLLFLTKSLKYPDFLYLCNIKGGLFLATNSRIVSNTPIQVVQDAINWATIANKPAPKGSELFNLQVEEMTKWRNKRQSDVMACVRAIDDEVADMLEKANSLPSSLTKYSEMLPANIKLSISSITDIELTDKDSIVNTLGERLNNYFLISIKFDSYVEISEDGRSLELSGDVVISDAILLSAIEFLLEKYPNMVSNPGEIDYCRVYMAISNECVEDLFLSVVDSLQDSYEHISAIYDLPDDKNLNAIREKNWRGYEDNIRDSTEKIYLDWLKSHLEYEYPGSDYSINEDNVDMDWVDLSTEVTSKDFEDYTEANLDKIVTFSVPEVEDDHWNDDEDE